MVATIPDFPIVNGISTRIVEKKSSQATFSPSVFPITLPAERTERSCLPHASTAAANTWYVGDLELRPDVPDACGQKRLEPRHARQCGRYLEQGDLRSR
jgi:hypothetical protein